MSTVARKRAAKIEQIHDVAAALFARHGYYRTRMEDIASGLDLQKGALYYYFESKEALLASLVEKRVGVALAVLEQIVDRDGPVTRRVAEAVTGHLSVFQEHADIYTIFNTERLHSISGEAAEKVNELGREYERLFAKLIEEGKASGEFRSELDTSISVKAILGACNATLSWFEDGGRLDIDAVADHFAELFLEGMSS